ncbi:sphingomyelin phosphodiesterase [Legionella gresilensis]|uniref:sphingomyelin phosphodiesterase n=1 Tax=Legionella gresilensis TaxID=91823 RepID=UPI001041235B|nr:sphingomyelin phosphodiesterase [Legionella gresilensis]
MDNTKQRITFMYVLVFTSLPSWACAQYDIFLRNDTPHTVYIDTDASKNLDPRSYHGWHDKALKPYQAAKVQVFNYDKYIDKGKKYKFNIFVKKHPNDRDVLLTFTTYLEGKSIGSHLYQSELTTKNQQLYFFDKKPQPMYSEVYSQKVENIFNSNKEMILYCATIKYTVPNPHFNFQSTDALTYTILEKQKPFNYNFNSKELSLLTYNVQLWPFYGPVGGIRLNRPEVRVNIISDYMKHYDIVSFQELMDKDYRQTLTNNMLQQYPFHYGPNMGKSFLSSGLMIFSRWPIIKSGGIIYKACSNIDCHADKGAIYIKIDKLGKIYHIFNTHLQANEKEDDHSDVRARIAQIQELKQFISDQNIPANEVVLLMGDLNINASQCTNNETGHCTEFKRLISELKVNYRVHKNYKVVSFSSDPSKNWMNTGNSKSILDYILPFNNQNIQFSYESKMLVLRGNHAKEMYVGTPYADTDLSDHFALEAKLWLYPK